MKLKDCSLTRETEEAMRLHPVPGMTAAAIRNGRIESSCFMGVRDDRDTPMGKDVLFEAASLTKSLFATLFLRLCGRGAAALDEPVLTQLPSARWSDDPRFSEITPRMILCHSSGLPNWENRPLKLLFAPGTSYSYSGDGYYLLQHLAEVKTGKELPELFQEEFFQPWGLNASGVWTPEVGARMSCGFNERGEVIKRRDAPDLSGCAPEPNAAWSLYANAEIYAGFLCQMIHRRGDLNEKLFREMTSRQSKAGGGIFWGLGWGIPEAQPSVLWHWGDNTGFKSFAVWDRDTGDGLTVFTNSDAGVPFYMELCRRMTDGAFFGSIEEFIAHAE